MNSFNALELLGYTFIKVEWLKKKWVRKGGVPRLFHLFNEESLKKSRLNKRSCLHMQISRVIYSGFSAYQVCLWAEYALE